MCSRRVNLVLVVHLFLSFGCRSINDCCCGSGCFAFLLLRFGRPFVIQSDWRGEIKVTNAELPHLH